MLRYMLRHIFEFLGLEKHCAEARPVAIVLDFSLSPIHKLPQELFFLIASYLSLESGASLSLTCHSLYSCLGRQCIEPLKGAESSVLNGFLRFLERDLPNHILCPHCNKLHSMSLAKSHLPSERYSQTKKPWLLCRKADDESFINIGIHKTFSSTIFRMAMKAYRQGGETDQILSLLSYGTENIIETGFVEQCTTAVRIQDDSLLVREQRVFMVPSSQKMPLPWLGSINICPHIKFATMWGMHKHGIEIPYADEIEGYENKQGIIYCEHCYTEFRVDFKSYGEVGNAMFVTRWMDIGEGRDVSDHKFRSRLADYRNITWTKVAFRRGSICAAFEQKAESEFKFDSLLTQQNEKDLCKKCPRPWPKDKEVSLDNARQFYMVRDGRFLPWHHRLCPPSPPPPATNSDTSDWKRSIVQRLSMLEDVLEEYRLQRAGLPEMEIVAQIRVRYRTRAPDESGEPTQ